MSKKLFVGGLPYNIDSPQLEEMFSKFGKIISCDVITDRYSGQSKGFGFVEMEDDAAAEEAITKLNETELDGRKIAVSVAKPREERPRFDNRGGGGSRGDDRGSRGGYR
ncbi:RNA-binding protein [Candidatus Shapirobacteria bacterium]|nr:RNA-binding protein [Candidatus Shapirobacteria bacterium]